MRVSTKDLYDSIANLDKKIDVMHAENQGTNINIKKDINALFEKVRVLDNIPCGIHIERFKYHRVAIAGCYVFLTLIAGWLITINYIYK